MKTIFIALKSGNAKDRLSIIADLTSIAGVSLAAILGGLLSLGNDIDVASLVAVIFVSLICLSGLLIALAISITASSFLWRILSSNPVTRFLLIFALWSSLLALFLLAAFYYQGLISSYQIRR